MSGATTGPETEELWPADGGPPADAAWPAPQMRVRPPRRRDPARPAGAGGAGAGRTGGRRRPPRRPVPALAGMIAFGLLAAFFAAQSAEPLWLALGRGVTGIATVARCDAATGAVLPPPATPPEAAPPQADPAPADPAPADPAAGPAGYRCVAFALPGGATVPDVTLFGAEPADGDPVPARMVTAGHDRAYAVSTAGLHLRWLLGLGMVALSGTGIVWATGAGRAGDPRQRRRAVLLCYAGPWLLLAGFVTAAW